MAHSWFCVGGTRDHSIDRRQQVAALRDAPFSAAWDTDDSGMVEDTRTRDSGTTAATADNLFGQSWSNESGTGAVGDTVFHSQEQGNET